MDSKAPRNKHFNSQNTHKCASNFSTYLNSTTVRNLKFQKSHFSKKNPQTHSLCLEDGKLETYNRRAKKRIIFEFHPSS